MERLMLKAIDLGYGQIKAMSEARQVEYPAAAGTFRPIRFTSGMEAQSLKDRLCIEFEGKRYFIGDIAFKQSAPRVTMSADRFTSAEGLALMMSALILLSNSQIEDIKLIAGLPVNEYSRLKDNYTGALQGSHYCQLIDPDGQENDFYRFNIEAAAVLPQPIGTLFNAVLDDSGALADKDLAAGRVAVLDIGKFTVDLALTDALQFVDRSSTGFNDIGLYDSFKDISLALKNKGYDIPADSLEPYIRGSRQLDCLPEIQEQAFAAQAEKIAARVVNTWPDLFSFDRVFITGGGALALGRYITTALSSDKVIVCESPTFTNCRGYFKFARRKWQ